MLPLSGVPITDELVGKLASKAEALHSSASAELRSCEAALAEFRQRMEREFPLDAAQCAALRSELQARVNELVAGWNVSSHRSRSISLNESAP